VQQDVKDVGGGAQTALIRDADGNVIGLLGSTLTATGGAFGTNPTAPRLNRAGTH
jgi:hypothetical protein